MPSHFIKIAVSLVAFVGQQIIHSPALAADQQTAPALEHAVLSGQDIHVVLDLSLCVTHGTTETGPMIRGNLHPDGFMVLSDHAIAFAVTHLTVRPDNTPIEEFLSFRVKPDGSVAIRNVFLSPVSYAIVRQVALDCEIGRGVSFNSEASSSVK